MVTDVYLLRLPRRANLGHVVLLQYMSAYRRVGRPDQGGSLFRLRSIMVRGKEDGRQVLA